MSYAKPKGLQVYRVGLCAMSVCAPVEMSQEDIEPASQPGAAYRYRESVDYQQE